MFILLQQLNCQWISLFYLCRQAAKTEHNMCHKSKTNHAKTDPMTRFSALPDSRIFPSSRRIHTFVCVSQSHQTALQRRSRDDLKLNDIPAMSQKHTLVLLHNTRTLRHSGVREGQSEPAGVAPRLEVRSLCATGIQLALLDHTSGTTARG